MSTQNDNSENVSNATASLTFRAPDFDPVIGRLKAALGLKTDAALHDLLGMSSSRYANRKRSGSIPFDQVIALCNSRNVNLNWLFYGEGPTFQDGRTVNSPATFDPELLMRIYAALARCYAKKGFNPEQGSAQTFGMILIAQAAGIYSSAVFESDESARKRRIEAESEASADAFILQSKGESLLRE